MPRREERRQGSRPTVERSHQNDLRRMIASQLLQSQVFIRMNRLLLAAELIVEVETGIFDMDSAPV